MSESESSFLPCFRYRQSACGTREKHEQPVMNGIREERDGDKQSEFDRLLFHRWKNAMEKGCFRYTLDHVKCRTIPGEQGFVAQVLTEESLHLALDMLLLSNHRGLRVCWNSLGALASVNHLHFHAMYLDYPLLVENIDAVHLAHGCYEVLNQSTRGFAFQLHGNTINTLARLIFKVSSYLTDRKVPHNMCMSYGDAFPSVVQGGTSNRNDDLTTIKVLLWPKKPMFDFGDDSPFSNACIEPAGFLVIKDFDCYSSLTEDEANLWLAKYSLEEEEFKSLKKDLSLYLFRKIK